MLFPIPTTVHRSCYTTGQDKGVLAVVHTTLNSNARLVYCGGGVHMQAGERMTRVEISRRKRIKEAGWD